MTILGEVRDSARSAGLPVTLFAGFLIAMLWGAAVFYARVDRNQAIAGAMQANSQLARAFEEHAVRTLAQAKQLAAMVRTEYSREGKTFDLARLFEKTQFDKELIQAVMIADETGRVIASSASLPAGTIVSDRKHFQAHVARDTGALVIGEPVLSRTTRRWSMLTTYRINKPDGSFGGVSAVALDPGYFSRLYKQIDLGKNGSVTLVGLDGLVRSRAVEDAQNAGQNIGGSDLFKQLEKSPHGNFAAEAKVDGVRRVYGYRKLADYPLIISVGTAEDTVLAESVAHRNMYFGGALLMSLLVAGAAWWLRQSAILQRRGSEMLQERELRLLDAEQLSGMVSLEWIVEEDRIIWSRSPEFLLGPKPLAGYPLFREMVHPDDRALWMEERKRALDLGGAGRYTDHRLIRTDGSECWISCVQRVSADAVTGAKRQIATLLDITERKLAEQALVKSERELQDLARNLERLVAERTSAIQASEETLRLVTENIPVAIAYFGADCLVKFANLRFAQAVGRENVTAVIGQSTSDLIPAERMPLYAGFIESARAGVPARYEIALRGDLSRFVEVNAAPDVGPDGQLQGVFVAMMDIAGHKRTEASLRTAVSQLSATLEATADAILVVGLTHDRVRFNGRYAEMAGLAPESSGSLVLNETLERFAQQMIDPDAFLSRVHEIYAQPLESSADVLEFKDGRVFERYSFPEMIDGEPVGRVFSFRDVTERRRAEAALRSADERYRAVVANMIEGVTVRDATGRIIDCNPSAARIVGRSVDEIRGSMSVVQDSRVVTQCGTFVPAERRSAMVALRTGQTQADVVMGYIRPDGQTLWLSSTSQPLFEAGSDKPTGVFTTFVDITARKQAETAREALEGQLRESQKMEAMGTLAGGIAHDFNNILGVILGNVALAREEFDAKHPAAKSLTEIDQAGKRAKALVLQILAFSRKQPQDFADLAMHPVIAETLSLLRATLPAGVQLETRFEEPPPFVHGSAGQIGQVLMNLCTNAWYAMVRDDGGEVSEGAASGRLSVSLGTVDLSGEAARRFGDIAPGKYACLSVQDDGAGMDAETQARIFEPFFTTKPFGQGTGLGLAVVHGIVKAHGGAVAIESSPGKGTTFEVLFPAIAEPQTAAVPASAAPLATAGMSRHVLYLDDEPAMVFLVQRMLGKLGYRVSGFEDPAEAVAAVRAVPTGFDIVVTDFNMPRMSGLDVAREIRKLNPQLPLVVTSGFISEELRTSAGLLGVRHVIYKPNTVEDLCQTIAQVLEAPLDGAS